MQGFGNIIMTRITTRQKEYGELIKKGAYFPHISTYFWANNKHPQCSCRIQDFQLHAEVHVMLLHKCYVKNNMNQNWPIYGVVGLCFMP